MPGAETLDFNDINEGIEYGEGGVGFKQQNDPSPPKLTKQVKSSNSNHRSDFIQNAKQHYKQVLQKGVISAANEQGFIDLYRKPPK